MHRPVFSKAATDRKHEQMAKTALERTIDFVGENIVSQNSVIRFVELIGDPSKSHITCKGASPPKGRVTSFIHH